MKKEYKRGDRVASGIAGYYYGLPGRITKPAQVQSGAYRRFVVALDIGGTITLAANRIIDLPEEEGGAR